MPIVTPSLMAVVTAANVAANQSTMSLTGAASENRSRPGTPVGSASVRAKSGRR